MSARGPSAASAGSATLPTIPTATNTRDNRCISLSSITLIVECSRFRYALSAVPVAEQVLDGVADLEHLAVKQMVRTVDDDELLGIVSARVELLHVFQWAELVPFALDEELRFVARPHVLEVVSRKRRCDSDQRRHAIVFDAGGKCHPGA